MRVFTEYGLCNCLETGHNLYYFRLYIFTVVKKIYLFPSHVYEDIMFLVTSKMTFHKFLVTAFFTGLGPCHDVYFQYIFRLYKFEYWTRLACQAMQVVFSLWNVLYQSVRLYSYEKHKFLLPLRGKLQLYSLYLFLLY